MTWSKDESRVQSTMVAWQMELTSFHACYSRLASFLCSVLIYRIKLSFASLSTMYWVYYLVWANELNEALREMTEPYSPRTDDNRFVEQKLERVGMIR